MKRATLLGVTGCITLGLFLSGLSSSWAIAGRSGSEVQNGDVNGDGSRSISDAVYLLQFLFSGGPAPIEPREPAASDEMVAEVKAAAAVVLERFPTAEESAALSPFRVAVLDSVGQKLRMAIEESAWSRRTLEDIAWVVTLSGVLVECNPFAVNQCSSNCTSAWNECRSRCDGDELCELHCDINYVVCQRDCDCD